MSQRPGSTVVVLAPVPGEDLDVVAPSHTKPDEVARATSPAVARLAPRQRWSLASLVVVLDALIAGPLIGRGHLFLLDLGDYPVGPHPQFAPSAFGFPPGVTSRAPVEAALYWLFQGTHLEALALLPFVAVAPLACLGFARLFPGRAVAIGASTLLFSVNPFVFERMANGQVYVVMGYSLLPLVLGVVVRPLASRAATAALGGLLFAAQIALSVHYAFITGLALMVLGVTHAVWRRREVVVAAASSLGAGIVLSLYWLVPVVSNHLVGLARVTRTDLSVFATLGDPRWGLGVNVAGLYGFWRPGAPLVKDSVAAWPLILVVLVAVVVTGVVVLVRHGGPAGRALALSCALFILLGFLLALGARGPTGGLYVFLFLHLPGFKVMREPDKFASLIALGYAAAFGVGLEALSARVTRRTWRRVALVVLCALPVAYGFTELWGFDGYARPTAYPADWTGAQTAIAPGSIALALPWSAYLPVPWLGGSVVANPLEGYFAGPVISGDNLQAGPIESESTDPRSLFLIYALAEGPRLHEFGRDLAALGARYVILAKTGNWHAFDWLDHQRDLRAVFNGPTIEVFVSDEVVPSAYEPSESVTLGDWGAVLALAERAPLVDYLIHVTHARPGLVTLPSNLSLSPPQSPRILSLSPSSPVSQSFAPTLSARDVVLTAPDYPGWSVPGFSTTAQFGVTVAFTRSATGASATVTARYGPFGLVQLWYVVGGALVTLDLGVIAVYATGLARRPRRREGHAPGASPRIE